MKIYEIPSDGTVAVSPGAGYYTGSEFRSFLSATFAACIPKSIDIQNGTNPVIIKKDFRVGGPLYVFDDLVRIEKQIKKNNNVTNSQKPQAGLTREEKQKKAAEKEFTIIVHTMANPINHETVVKNGKNITTSWFEKNSLPMSEEAIKVIEEIFPDQAVRDKIKIELFDTDGKNVFSELQPGKYNSKSPAFIFTINVQDWESLWINDRSNFTKDLSMLIHHFEKGRDLAAQLIFSGQVKKLYMSGLDDKSIIKLEKNYIQLEKLSALQADELQFMCVALGLSYTELTDELKRLDSIDIPDFDSRAKIAFMGISLAALEYFDRKNKQLLEKTLTQMEIDELRPQLLKIFRSNLQFMISESTSFLWFHDNILYAQPKELDAIQRHITDVISATYGKQLVFPVRYITSSSNNSQSKTSIAQTSTSEETILNKRRSTDSNSSNSNGEASDRLNDSCLLSAFNGSVNQLIQMSFKTESSALTALQMLHQFIVWYQLALQNICSQNNFEGYETYERSFWLSVIDILDAIEKKAPNAKKVSPDWCKNIELLAKDAIIQGKDGVIYQGLYAVQQQLHTLQLINRNENTKPLLITENQDKNLLNAAESVRENIQKLEDTDFTKAPLPLFRAFATNLSSYAKRASERSLTFSPVK